MPAAKSRSDFAKQNTCETIGDLEESDLSDLTPAISQAKDPEKSLENETQPGLEKLTTASQVLFKAEQGPKLAKSGFEIATNFGAPQNPRSLHQTTNA